MNGIAPIGACVLAVALVLDGQKHVEVRMYHGAPQHSNPFDVVSTATAQAVFPTANSSLSRIPI